jgi:N-acetylglucosamine kinase-like BadF-type ATPase
MTASPDGPRPVAIAVDGGGSKTDVVAIDLDGSLLAHARGAGTNPQVFGLDSALATVGALVAEVRSAIGPHEVRKVDIYLAGLDLPAEITAFQEGVAGAGWAADVTADRVLIENDLFALLRAGAAGRDAVAVVCGTGINAVGRRSDGATARFPALGPISGDWGGGGSLGMQALWHAVRSEDGRGPASVLEQLVARHFGCSSVMEVVEGLHFGRLSTRSIAHLTPLLFEAARAGDPLARADIERQAEEIVTMAATALRRLDLLTEPVQIVLGGGVLAAAEPLLLDPVQAGLAAAAPRSAVHLVTVPPIVGAVLLVLESLSAPSEALEIARADLAGLFESGAAAARYPEGDRQLVR